MWLLVVGGSARAWAQATGSIEGSVRTETGAGIPGAIVSIANSPRVATTDQAGEFRIAGLPAGRYLVTINVGEFEAGPLDVSVQAGTVARLDKVLPNDFSVVLAVTVNGASRTPELMANAPMPVTIVSEPQVELRGGSGQIPALLQFAPGVDFVQSGVYNMELNARGFNTALSRRVQVLIDGRDAAAPESKNQEWLTVGFLTADIKSVELVRGPGAALYGANSMNGVLAIETKTPRATPGGRVRATTGDLSTFLGDARWAGAIGGDWYMKAVANYTTSSSYTRSRVDQIEYAGLSTEVVAALPDTTSKGGALRFDKYTTRGHQLIFEGGMARTDGGTYLTQAGRLSVDRSTRSWGRTDYRSGTWRGSVYFNGRSADQSALYAPISFPTETWQVKAEVQGQTVFAGDRGRVIGGASFLREHTDSADASGRQTLYQQALTTSAPAIFGQVDYHLAPQLKAVGAIRWDNSTLHDTQWSPRAALVFSPSPRHSMRVSASRGFQVGNYTELFLNVPAAPPADLSAVETALAPLLGGVSLGLSSVPIFAIGNANLGVESITNIEAGYAATFGSRGRISIDVYRSRMRNFISDLLPGVNTAYPPYVAPSSLSPDARALVEQTLRGIVGPALTNLPDGRAQVVLSNANIGEARSRGIEVSGAFRPTAAWSFDASYTWFDFTLVDAPVGLEPKPNSPTHRGAAGVTYQHQKLAASYNMRWVRAFDWASGVFSGPVPAYEVSDLAALYNISSRWQLGVNVSNLFDRRHYEMFGGDLLRRRALAHLTINW